MTVIRVNPESVRSYGREAQSIFNEMHQSLVDMVNELVNVRFYGPNAVAFKTEIGRVSADFANRLHNDMSSMAEAVRRSTSNIQASLGGQPLALSIDPRPITPPVPQATDYVDLDTEALQSMIGVVNTRFSTLDSGLSSNLQRLQATDWEGNAKLAAVDAVNGFTSGARNKCVEAKEQIITSVNRQIEAAHSADK
jgi:hypothetical protein